MIMPTNMLNFRSELIRERSVVQGLNAIIDHTEEAARYTAAQEDRDRDLRKFSRAQTRWNLTSGVSQRLADLDDQIAQVTPGDPVPARALQLTLEIVPAIINP
jgi:hypothetical protein